MDEDIEITAPILKEIIVACYGHGSDVFEGCHIPRFGDFLCVAAEISRRFDNSEELSLNHGAQLHNHSKKYRISSNKNTKDRTR